MTRRYMPVLALLFCGLLLGCSAEAGKDQSQDNKQSEGQQVAAKRAAIGQQAPEFTLTDTDGNEHNLSDFRGKHVVLEWINFDCPFVKAHYNSGNMPGLQAKYTEQGVVWLTICSSAPGKQGHFTGETLESRMEQAGFSGTAYLIDETGKVGRMYEAKTTPHMFVIDPQGTLLYAGAIDEKPTTDEEVTLQSTNYVATALDAALAGNEVPVKTSQPYGCSVKY